MTFPAASAIIIKHSANAYRGIAQLVEQRSPKPRAVSSRLTTPARKHSFFGSCAFLFSGGMPQKLSVLWAEVPLPSILQCRCGPHAGPFCALFPDLQNSCLTSSLFSDIIEHVPAVSRRANLSDHGPVAQLVRAPACHAGGRRFEPDPGRLLWRIQSILPL